MIKSLDLLIINCKTRVNYILIIRNILLSSVFLIHFFSCNSFAKNRDINFSGKVIYGRQEAKSLGFPTANVKLTSNVNIKPGVYSCIADLENHKKMRAMCYFDDKRGDIIEVNLFDLDQSLYGSVIDIFLIEFIRAKINFPNKNFAVKQLEKDKIDSIKSIKNYIK